MPIITLTTDLGLKDYYVGAIKGTIYKHLKDVNIVDISHYINRFDITQAAFVIKNVFQDFPKGTVHILGVRPNQNVQIKHVAVQYADQFFVGADNGIFSLFLDAAPQKVVRLESSELSTSTFPTRDVFAAAAAHLAGGKKIESLGESVNTLNQSTGPRAVLDESVIRGTVIYVDTYGNAITNISKDMFEEIGQNRPFQIMFRMPNYEISTISKAYDEVVEGERLALFGSSGLLQISMNAGNASQLLGLELNSSVTVQFI